MYVKECHQSGTPLTYVKECHQSGSPLTYVREGVSPVWERGLGVCSCPGPMGIPNDVIQQVAQLLAMQLESPRH